MRRRRGRHVYLSAPQGGRGIPHDALRAGEFRATEPRDNDIGNGGVAGRVRRSSQGDGDGQKREHDHRYKEFIVVVEHDARNGISSSKSCLIPAEERVKKLDASHK